jgi:hypothetical protein
MTASAAVVGIVLALIAGFYFSRYDRAERTARLARAAAGTAGAQVWRHAGRYLSSDSLSSRWSISGSVAADGYRSLQLDADQRRRATFVPCCRENYDHWQSLTGATKCL